MARDHTRKDRTAGDKSNAGSKNQAGRQSSRAVPGTSDREQTQWRRFNWMWTEYARNEVRQQKKALQTDINNIKRAFLALCEVQTEQVRNAGPE